ncbi:MAG: helix-turn-helix domain-containing protein [Clostridiales bacterium]|nr:helix-turn-helix domain-containing protein [Clostridiales bacterium]MDY4654735.1 helix-turn-helix transcriptional regulator [Eubacteriales bacterium]
MTDYDFKDILLDFMIQKGLTQTAFANIVDIKQSQVSEWLKGKAKPGYDMLKKIASSFNISADYFLGLKDSYK